MFALTRGLRSSSILGRPLQVNLAPKFLIKAKPELRADIARKLYKLGLTIQSGLPLDESFYRRDRHNTPDELLTNTGIMHLHPLGEGTNELLFLVQYETCVLFLEVSDHDHFAVLPRGHLLLTAYADAISDQEQKNERLKQQRRQVWGGTA